MSTKETAIERMVAYARALRDAARKEENAILPHMVGANDGTGRMRADLFRAQADAVEALALSLVTPDDEKQENK